MMPRPTTTSAAATTSTKNTIDLAADVVELRGEGDEGEVDGVEHQLDAHEHHQRVAPDQQPDGADGEQQRAEHQVPGRGDLQAAITCDLSARLVVVGLGWSSPRRPSARASATHRSAISARSSAGSTISSAARGPARRRRPPR